MPRLGTEPSGDENDSVSDVRLSSSTLSPTAGPLGSGVGVCVLLGRKIVLNPLPWKFPTNAASGPRLGAGAGGCGCGSGPCGTTSAILKLFGNSVATFRSSPAMTPSFTSVSTPRVAIVADPHTLDADHATPETHSNTSV